MARTLKAVDGGKDKRANQLSSAEAKKFFDELDGIHDKMESQAGEHRSDIKDVYTKASEALDVSRKVIAHEYALRRRAKKVAKREAELEDSEKLSLEQLRTALGPMADTPLGQAAGA